MGLREEGYWEKHYELELKNFEEDGDPGEIWFGKGLSRRINEWIVSRILSRDDWASKIKLVDIGCGNSYTITSLLEKYKSVKTNYRLEALGLDFANNSIELSRKIVNELDMGSDINLIQCDFLDSEQLFTASQGDKFDFIIDKGTYDAIILLAGDKIKEAQIKYMKSLNSLVRENSIFILASCNHTKHELMPLFELDCQASFSYTFLDTIETPKIVFGGREGSQVTCLVMKVGKHL